MHDMLKSELEELTNKLISIGYYYDGIDVCNHNGRKLNDFDLTTIVNENISLSIYDYPYDLVCVDYIKELMVQCMR